MNKLLLIKPSQEKIQVNSGNALTKESAKDKLQDKEKEFISKQPQKKVFLSVPQAAPLANPRSTRGEAPFEPEAEKCLCV
jgi:hypothetical protein